MEGSKITFLMFLVVVVLAAAVNAQMDGMNMGMAPSGMGMGMAPMGMGMGMAPAPAPAQHSAGFSQAVSPIVFVFSVMACLFLRL
ncbi:unnamed protein product [Amaranthus hypochondriacus]